MKQYPILLQVFWIDTQFHETICNFTANLPNWYPISRNNTQFHCNSSKLIPNFIKQYPISLQVFWTDAQFHETIPNFVHFQGTLKLEMKRGLEAQTRAKRSGVVTFHKTFIMPWLFFEKTTYLWKHYWNQLWAFWDLRKINKNTLYQL
jgi:hypothetical protein